MVVSFADRGVDLARALPQLPLSALKALLALSGSEIGQFIAVFIGMFLALLLGLKLLDTAIDWYQYRGGL